MTMARHGVLILLAALLGAPTLAIASPGDVVVPAHRTRDGEYVPANVPPLSAGTHLARRPSRGASGHRLARRRLGVPLLVEAKSIRR